MRTEQVDMYEGKEPYVFISYSHKDQSDMWEVRAFLEQEHVRYWYDNGLHSGDDWNFTIASHLEGAAVCLLLLSENSAGSDYVKNELNFALNHRIPIHTLLLKSFVLPIDIEIMIGRIQMIEKKEGYEQELIRALPPELVFSSGTEEGRKEDVFQHPLYEPGDRLLDRQGTIFYSGCHKILKYPVLIQQDVIRSSDREKLMQASVTACNLDHPLFIHLIDVRIEKNSMWSCFEFHKVTFLDDFLKDHEVDEKTITKWILTVIDGMEYLQKKGYAISDFARGSLVVTDDRSLRILRLHNAYYGIFRVRVDNRQYYIDHEIEEIAVLLYQLCTGEVPIMPFPTIKESHVSHSFLRKANLIIQKAMREQGRSGYVSFGEMAQDLRRDRVRLRDQLFLRQREQKLEQYMKAKEKNRQRFTGEGIVENSGAGEEQFRTRSLEEEFGFDPTVSVFDAVPAVDIVASASPSYRIRLLICSTGQVLQFTESSIVVGRRPDLCDVVFTQKTMSYRHMRISRSPDDSYLVEDLNSKNGVRYGDQKTFLRPGQEVSLPAGTILDAGGVELKLLP